MAEGPVVHFYANMIHDALQGQELDVEFGINRLKGRGQEFDGVTLDDVQAQGKVFRIRFSDGRIVLVHLLMWGTWRVYDAGEEWDKPESRARLIMRGEGRVAVAFSAPVIRVFENEDELAKSRWGDPGPDPLREDWSEEEFRRRLAKKSDAEIGEVIMDQRVLGGVGNILRNEILFFAGVHPRRVVSDLSDEELRDILDHTIRLMRNWLDNMGGKKEWRRVYQRSGQPCLECGAEIEFFRQNDRVTYACPRCQT